MSAPSVTAIPLILPLDSPHASLGAVGGKGASLARLSAAALPVPPGFHVTTTAYRRFVDANHLLEVIRRAAGRASIDDPASLERASALIRALIAQGSVPRDIAEGVGAAYAVLGAGEPEVAVRSSATAEDLPELSFAGQHDSFLNVRGADAVLAAVKRCWASLWTARAIGYRARQGIDGADVNMAVVVQRLVPADVAGILFTANPMTGVRDEVVINAAWGLGEAIVAGHVTPDTFRVDKATGAIRSADVMDKVVQTVRTDGGTREVPLSASLRTAPTLSPVHIAELTRLGTRIEALYGHPVDVEWAIADGTVRIVQARPITALPDPIVELDWTTPNPTGRYARSSVIELLPEPLSPLFETLALPRWNRAMAALMEEIGLARVMTQLTDLTTINGFAYYDYSMSPAQTFRLLFHFLTHPGSLIDHFRRARSMWADGALPRYRAVAAEWAERDLAEASAGALLAGAARITDAAADYYLTIQSGILPVAYIGEACFTYFYNRLAKRKGDPPAIAYLLGFDSKPIHAEKALFDLAQWSHEHPDLAAALTSMTAAEIASALDGPPPPGVADDVWNVFATLFAAHLKDYGDAVYDLDFSKPLAADNPSPLLEALKSFVAGDARSPHARQAVSSAAREAATNALRSRLRGRRGRFVGWLLGGAQQFAPLREDALADVGLGWPQLRRMMHALGERAVAAGAVAASDDVYWLTVDELQDVAQAIDSGRRGADHAGTVAERRATAAHNRTVTPPVALPLKGGAKFLGMDLMRFMPALSHQDGSDTIKGIGASPGRVTGAARVILGPEHFHAMRHGDILVTKITTPAWTPLFALAAGIVTDVGGPLSHSSIVAREYGIPAVLGTGVATVRVKDGERITVDGDGGRVVLER